MGVLPVIPKGPGFDPTFSSRTLKMNLCLLKSHNKLIAISQIIHCHEPNQCKYLAAEFQSKMRKRFWETAKFGFQDQVWMSAVLKFWARLCHKGMAFSKEKHIVPRQSQRRKCSSGGHNSLPALPLLLRESNLLLAYSTNKLILWQHAKWALLWVLLAGVLRGQIKISVHSPPVPSYSPLPAPAGWLVAPQPPGI